MADETRAELDNIVTKFPDHRTLGAALQDGVNRAIEQFRLERGDVASQEDVYGTVRWMQGTAEAFEDYARAFGSGAALIRQYAEEELSEAVGALKSGQPKKGLTVPDTDGTDIKLTVDVANRHIIHKDQVLQAFAVAFVEEHAAADLLGATFLDLYRTVELKTEAEEEAVYNSATMQLVTLLLLAIQGAGELGKHDLQVTKVAAFAKELARRDTLLASTVTGAMRTESEYKGVKMSRETPKPRKAGKDG